MRRFLSRIVLFYAALAITTVVPARADTIILHTGERFTSGMIWEEGSKIRFNMDGLLVSVNKTEVAAILGEDGSPRFLNTDRTLAPPNADVPEKIAETAPQSQPSPVAPPRSDDNDKNNINRQKVAPSDRAPLSHAASSTPHIPGTGLKGLYWLMKPEEIPGLVFYQKEPEMDGIDQYYRPDERKQLEHARLDGIVYGFWRNQLYSIMYWVQGRPGYKDLKEVVAAHFGMGVKSKSGIERYIWRSRDTDRMLEFDKQLNTGIFWMRSRLVDEQIKRQQP